MEQSYYLEATENAGKNFYLSHQHGPVVMLNLLRFKKIADYSAYPSIQPEQEISGEEAYRSYMDQVSPLLKQAGSSVLFYGKSNAFLIGPENEKWDAVLLVKHASASQFIAFANNEEYIKYAGHRTAALQDSRLLPITQQEFNK